MKINKLFFILFLLSCIYSNAQDLTYTTKIAPTGDTYVQPNKDPKGAEEIINSKNFFDAQGRPNDAYGRFSFVKYDLSGLTADVDTAVLNLMWVGKQQDTISGQKHVLFNVDPTITWDEATLDFETAIAKFSSDAQDTANWYNLVCGKFADTVGNTTYHNNVVAEYELDPVENLETDGKLIEIDVTELVNTYKGTVITLALFDYWANGKQVKFGSKENSDPAKQPFIGIVEAGATSPVVDNPLADLELVEGYSSEVIDLSAVFSDPNGDALTLSASSTDETVATVAVSGSDLTITEAGIGSSTISVTASDGTEEVTEEFVLTVIEYDPNKIENGDFDTGDIAPWSTYLPGWISYVTADFSVVDGAAAVTNITIADPDHADNPQEAFYWHIMLEQKPKTFENGKSYTINFDAWVEEAREVSLFIGSDDGSIKYLQEYIEPGTEKTNYNFQFDMTEPTDDNARVSFELGLDTPGFYLDNVVLVEGDYTDVEKNEVFNSRVYPNPAKDILNISFKQSSKGNVQIYNTLGTLVKQIKVNGTSSSIDISTLQNGIYFVRTHSGEIHKILVQ
jgi:hypothetical protein